MRCFPATCRGEAHDGPSHRQGPLALIGCLTVAAALTFGQADVATAAFTGQTHSTGTFTASVLQPPTALTATAGCTPTSPTTISFRASSSATGTSSVTAARPAGTQPGDLLLALWAQRHDGAAVTPPDGWTLLHRQDSPTGQFLSTASYYRQATSADPTSWAWTSLRGENAAVVIVGYTGVSAAAVPVSAAQNSSTDTTTVTAPSVTTVRPNSRLVALFGFRGTGGLTPQTGLTERADVWTSSTPGSNNVDVAVADAPFDTVGSTGARTATATTGATGYNAGHLVALRAHSSPQVALAWTATTSTYASGYTVQRLTGGTLPSTRSVTPASVTSLTDSPLAASTTYDYRVWATAQNWSSTAALASVTTTHC